MIQYIEEALVPGAPVCVVHFRSRTKQAEGFEKYPTPPGVSNIYVNNGSSGWYLDGLPGYGDARASALAIKAKAQAAGASKIVCVGASMGAFGAAMFSSIMGAELICFAPELWLNVYTGFSRRDVPGRTLDIATMGQPSRALFVAGISCPTDLICALHFHRAWPNSEAIFLPDCGHESARHLKDKELLAPLLADFCFGRDLAQYKALSVPMSILEGCPTVPPKQLNRATMVAFVEALTRHLLLSDRVRMADRLAGEKCFAAAVPLIGKIRAEHGEIAEVHMLDATVHRKQQRHAESIEALQKVEHLPEFRCEALWLRGMALEQLGRVDEALRAYLLLLQEGKGNREWKLTAKAAAVRVAALSSPA
ncbi:MAG: hypothetical protein H0W40_08965 [Methylibium sp.]|uniref:alpha/beta fold hydrolase n=1 Tax=Methylibium sp. TaxID=2067992 RepID=UPI0017A9042F|nr:tetratricopeptide repeat protein [Methylibium sp.]MBA3597496.1 hypothetical protein [Methylibium sp.]